MLSFFHLLDWHEARAVAVGCLAGYVGILVSLAASFLILRWARRWNLLPPPVEGPIPYGVRATVEGVIRYAEQTIPVADEPERECVAWVCASDRHFFRRWHTRSRPFVLELDDGRSIVIDLETPHWHAGYVGYRPAAHRTDIWNLPEPGNEPPLFHQLVAAAAESNDDDDQRGEDSCYVSPYYFSFRCADVGVGDRVTISGFFTPTDASLADGGYRGESTLQAYVVSRGSALPPEDLPPKKSLRHWRGRSPRWLSTNHVVCAKGSYEDLIREQDAQSEVFDNKRQALADIYLGLFFVTPVTVAMAMMFWR